MSIWPRGSGRPLVARWTPERVRGDGVGGAAVSRNRTPPLHPPPASGKAGGMKRKAGQDRSITANWRPATLAVRGGTARSEYGETSEALFLTSGYTYDKAGEAPARFAGEQEGR